MTPVNTGSILLTGATGVVGCEIVREFFRRDATRSMVVLLRGTAREVEKKRSWLLEWGEVPAGERHRLEAIGGDMTTAGLGIPPGAPLLRSVTDIIHAGAVTRFDQTREVAIRNNVTSTSNVFALARSCHRLERIAVISTAHVAGRRCGTILEDELDCDTQFNNEYERSKAFAEDEARKAMSDLPIAILRLALVVGRRTDGRVAHFSGLYPVLRLFYRGLLAMFPGDAGQLLDVIPSDFASRAVWHLLDRNFTAGKTYHVCAGRDRSLAVGELFPKIAACIAAVDSSWERLGRPLPLAVSSAVFQNFIEIVEMTGNTRLRDVVRQMQTVTRPMESPKIFDTTQLDLDLANDGPSLTNAREWLQPIITHAVETSWQHGLRPTHG